MLMTLRLLHRKLDVMETLFCDDAVERSVVVMNIGRIRSEECLDVFGKARAAFSVEHVSCK